TKKPNRQPLFEKPEILLTARQTLPNNSIKRAGKRCQRKCGNETKCLQTVTATLKRR
ncbi:15710_t:CDS:1, partial [Gigaspora rosea]